LGRRNTHRDTARTTKQLLEESKRLMDQMRRLRDEADALAETHRHLMQELKRRKAGDHRTA